MNPTFAKSDKAPYETPQYVAPGEQQEKPARETSPPIYLPSPAHGQNPQAYHMSHPQPIPQPQFIPPQPMQQSPTLHQPQPTQQIHHPPQVYQMQQPQPVPQMQQTQPGQQSYPVVNLYAQPQPQPYLNATPIRCLNMSSSVVDCPTCGQRAMTNITHMSGNTTHIWAGVLCFLTCFFCWVPYLLNGLKDVQHRCSTCGTLLATWHKSGGTEVHVAGG